MTKSHCFHLRAVWSQCEVSWWSAISFSCANAQIMKPAAAFARLLDNSVKIVLFEGNDKTALSQSIASIRKGIRK